MKKPTIKECYEWCNNMEQATLFFHYFESTGWKVGSKPMVKWKSALTGWIKRNESKQTKVEKAVSNTGTSVINKLWVRMSQIYGSKWVSNYGEVPTQPWINLINNMPHEKIAHGLNEIIKEGDNWPPSLSKFNRMCQSMRSPHKALNSPTKQQRLAQRASTQSARLNAMNQIRGMVG